MNKQQIEWADRRKTLDPGVFRPKYYTLPIVISAGSNTNSGSVAIDGTPFLLDTITHSYVGLAPSLQTGNYQLAFREEQTLFNSQPAMAHSLYGSVYNGGEPVPLPMRVFLRGRTSLTMDIISYDDPAYAPYTIEIVFHGFERWDKATEWGKQ